MGTPTTELRSNGILIVKDLIESSKEFDPLYNRYLNAFSMIWETYEEDDLLDDLRLDLAAFVTLRPEKYMRSPSELIYPLALLHFTHERLHRLGIKDKLEKIIYLNEEW